MGGFLGPQRASYLLSKAHSLISLSRRTRSQRAKLLSVYVLVISLLLILACSRIPNPFSSVSALPIARAAKISPTPTPPRYSQNQFPTGTGESSDQAFSSSGTDLDYNPILGPVEPATVLAALQNLTRTPIAPETVDHILGGLATPLAALESPTSINAVPGQVTPTPTPSTGLPVAVEIASSPTPSLEDLLPTEEPVGPVAAPQLPAAPVVATPTEAPLSPTPTATPTAQPTPTETPGPVAPVGGLPPGPVASGETPTVTPFGNPTPTSTVGPTDITPTATPTRTPRPTRTPNPAYPTLTPIPEGAFLDVVDIRLSPGSYTGAPPGSGLTFEIWVEPNGQEVSVVQVVIEFDPDVLQAKSSNADPDAPLSVRLIPDDTFDNDEGVIVMSISQDKNVTESPSTMFLMGTIKLKVDSSISGDTTTSVDFVRFGDVRTVAGIEGAEVTDDLYGASIMIELPPTPTPVPPTPVP